MNIYSRQLYILEDCDGKRIYIHIPIDTGEVGIIEENFSNGAFVDGGFVTVPKCGLECSGCCCRKIYRVLMKDKPQYDTTHLPEYNDNTLLLNWDNLNNNDVVSYISPLSKTDESCHCEESEEPKYYYFNDLCSEKKYAIDIANFLNVGEDVELQENSLYELWINDEQRNQSVRHFCVYIESADDPEIVLLNRKRIRTDIPINKFDCGGSFVFQKCGSEIYDEFIFVDGIEISQLQQNSFYLVSDSKGLESCYMYVGRNSNTESESIIHISSGSYSDCNCKKGSILFKTCDGEHIIECNSWLISSTYTVDNYYSVSTGMFTPVLNFDGYFYKNCLKYIGFKDDNPELEPDYTGLLINKSRPCEHDDCSIYFETTMSSCLGDYESTVYVSGELLNFMHFNEYNSFMLNGKNCLTLSFTYLEYVSKRTGDIPTIELEDVTAFYHNCDECIDTLDISCYVIHPCDGSRDIYIEKSQQGAMCEPIDLSIYENRYISFNYFGEIKCGFVEHYCKELTENDRRISSNNIIECYYSCAECIDNEEEKQKEVQETKQKVGREIEPNYTANDEYCNKKHKHCCCDDH